MTTLEFMEKELQKCKINMQKETQRNAPAEHVENIKKKVGYYTEVCDILRKKG